MCWWADTGCAAIAGRMISAPRCVRGLPLRGLVDGTFKRSCARKRVLAAPQTPLGEHLSTLAPSFFLSSCGRTVHLHLSAG
mmetsp:Transcript_9403/g.18420  ORF Transcript_9403/g.18420 Transcript_9403/m.18420 type:complete len:81 (+) Transcript_9403:92-334(+)